MTQELFLTENELLKSELLLLKMRSCTEALGRLHSERDALKASIEKRLGVGLSAFQVNPTTGELKPKEGS